MVVLKLIERFKDFNFVSHEDSTILNRGRVLTHFLISDNNKTTTTTINPLLK